MKVHLIKRQTIEEYSQANASSRKAFMIWIEKINYADWKIPSDIKTTFNESDLLGKGSDRVIFNIAGNKFRMICKYFFGDKQVHLYVCWIGTHSEYTKICNAHLQYTINLY